MFDSFLLNIFNLAASSVCLLIAFIFTQSQKKTDSAIKKLESDLRKTNEEMRKEYISRDHLDTTLKNIELQIKANQEIILEKIKKIEENTNKIEEYFLSEKKQRN